MGLEQKHSRKRRLMQRRQHFKEWLEVKRKCFCLIETGWYVFFCLSTMAVTREFSLCWRFDTKQRAKYTSEKQCSRILLDSVWILSRICLLKLQQKLMLQWKQPYCGWILQASRCLSEGALCPICTRWELDSGLSFVKAQKKAFNNYSLSRNTIADWTIRKSDNTAVCRSSQ